MYITDVIKTIVLPVDFKSEKLILGDDQFVSVSLSSITLLPVLTLYVTFLLALKLIAQRD